MLLYIKIEIEIEKFNFNAIIKGEIKKMEEIKKTEDYMNMSFSISPTADLMHRRNFSPKNLILCKLKLTLSRPKLMLCQISQVQNFLCLGIRWKQR